MATAARFRIDVAIHDLLMNSTQMPPRPAEARGLTLPEPPFPRFLERLMDPGPRLRNASGAPRMFTAIHADGWRPMFVRAFCPESFTLSPRIYLSNTNA